MSNPPPDPTATVGKPPYVIPTEILRTMTLTLPRPHADAPETAWQDTVQGGLDILENLDPRDALEATLAVQFIALGTAALDACRLAFEAGTSATQALRQRASAASLTRAMGGVMRLLTVQRMAPVVAARDWGGAAAALTAAWQAAPARPAEAPRGGTAAAAEPAEIIRWIDEIDDVELAEAVEADRKEKAGEPPLPRKPGPKVIYKYKPDDYIHRFKPDERAKRPYPGWENMTKPERRAFFGYTYTGPVAPLEMLTPASQAAAAAGEE
jgi:hypothetical protein